MQGVNSVRLRVPRRVAATSAKRLNRDARSLHATHVTRIRRILYMLRSARQPRDMDQPGFRLHPLRGEYQGHWSVTVSGNWRIVFCFEAGEATDVDLVDH